MEIKYDKLDTAVNKSVSTLKKAGFKQYFIAVTTSKEDEWTAATGSAVKIDNNVGYNMAMSLSVATIIEAMRREDMSPEVVLQVVDLICDTILEKLGFDEADIKEAEIKADPEPDKMN